ncbi:hypothetical protein [Halalkalibacter oceani]|uniref:hypothetical protein n=1 Tax=Halalkalibacter oceani TaxID=1653776 RepID=UPI00339A8E8A
MSKKVPLQVGQKVWLETVSKFWGDIDHEQKLEEMIVLEANKTSAYIWYYEKSKVRYKVDQKTHQVQYGIPDGCSYRLWLSKEEYEKNVSYKKEMKEMLEQAHKKVNQMSLEELRILVN